MELVGCDETAVYREQNEIVHIRNLRTDRRTFKAPIDIMAIS